MRRWGGYSAARYLHQEEEADPVFTLAHERLVRKRETGTEALGDEQQFLLLTQPEHGQLEEHLPP